MTTVIEHDLVSRCLARAQRLRGVIAVAYALLVPAAVWLAIQIPNQGALDRLIVPSDPDYIATRAFQAIFPEPHVVLLVFEADDPWSAGSLARIDRAEAALAHVPHVGVFSLLDAIRRARPDVGAAGVRRLATGTDFFRRQGLAGDHFLALVVNLDTHDATERDIALAAVDAALAAAGVSYDHAVGEPLVASWLEQQSSHATSHSFAIFGVLLVVVTWFLYRSWRALAAIVVALGSAVALGIAAGAVLGFAFTIVSALVPLTIMVTTLASLTYLHSRFVDQPEGVPLAEHQVAALRNKLLPVTASMVAAALGFAALSVSTIRPIREMGVWTAVGLVIAWVVAYTLFPALQLLFATPTRLRVAVRTRAFEHLVAAIPRLTYRFRFPLLATAIAVCIAGAIAILGIPGAISPISVEVDTLSNIDPNTPLARDLRWFRANVMDLNIARLWIHLPRPSATEPDVLRAIDRLDARLEHLPDITAVAGPTTPLRMRSYLAGRGEALPADPEHFAAATADVEQLMLAEPDLRTFIDVNGLADLQLTVLFRNGDARGYAAMARRVRDAWTAACADSPALEGAELHVVGESLLQVKIGAGLVPTLAESFVLTCVLILVVFVVIFRSGLERLLAMIPSLFALLATFLGMRLLGGSLNVATIIIATTVLGTTESDQLHFFHHMHERTGAPLEERLGHALRIAGPAVVFATVINACGFLGLATSHFPPLRQFGLMTAAAFVLALAGDFAMLPAALWIASRERPLERKKS